MPLQVLNDRHVPLTLHLELDDGIHPGFGGQGPAQVRPVHGDGYRLGSEAVEHPGNPAIATNPPARTGTGGPVG